MAIQAQSYPNNIGFPGSQDWIIDNSCGTGGFTQACFNERQMNHNIFLDANLVVSTSKTNNINYLTSVLNSQSLALQFEMQSQEIDHYIKLQNEKLRMKLQEQRKQQMATILKKVELDMIYLLRQKDQEIAQAAKKRVELEDFLNRLEAENQAWRRAAEEREAMILSLNNTLEEMKEKAYYSFNSVLAHDAQSYCDESRGNYKEMEEEEATGENVKEDDEQITRKMMVCKSCNSGMSCCLFLPCRHLCSCKACEAFLEDCPVCRMPKKATIETLFF